ncbi:MAG: ribosome small subunit-dependent GTPase A [Ruminococcaceae bacterium]|nr:ribosome small subunit-dependent GTPase A [Oscillospiraceae bacterium]
MEQKGIIIKGLGGLYDVLCNGEITQCRARGLFRHENITPYVGDTVTFEDEYITDISDRKNSLIRPPMANLDTLFIVCAAKKPLPVPQTIDKMISIADFKGIEPVIIITKKDLDAENAENLAEIYRKIGIEVFITEPDSDKSDLLAYFKEKCNSKISAFTGASGVGKSTLLNALFPNLKLATGDVSRKISRGKHTTRHVELYPLNDLFEKDYKGFIADTPGFSMLDPTIYEDYTVDELPYTFREFEEFLGNCKYTKCTHTKEEGCAVLEAVREGIIPESRHQSYTELRDILKNIHSWDKK